MHRITKTGAALAGLALVLSACGSGDEETPTASPPSGTLTIWADATAGTAKTVEPLCKSWAEANGVSCKVQGFNSAPEMRDQVITATSSGGELPDIFIGAHDWVGQLVTNGVLAPIDLGSKAASFSEAAVKAAQFNGQNYAVPFAVENVALLTNTDLVSGCPATLDVAESEAKDLVSSKKATIGITMQLPTPDGDAYHWLPLLTADGGYLVGQNADGSYNAADIGIGKEGSIAAAKRLQQLVDDKVMKGELTYEEAKAAFAGGKSPYFISGPWVLADVQDVGSALTVCPVPNWEGSSSVSTPYIGVQQFYQTLKAPNPTLASTFLNDEVMTTAFMDSMFVGTQRPPAWLESYQKASTDPIIAGFGKYGQQGIPQPALPEMAIIYKETGLAQSKVATGSDPETEMVKAGQNIQKGIADLGQ